MIELGRVIALVPALIPFAPPNRSGTGPARTRGRTARQIRNRLVHEGFSRAVKPPRKVRGISDRTHTVDLSYATQRPLLDLGGSIETIVHVLAVDLDVSNPFERADRSIAAANDLLWSSDEDNEINVRMVYGFGTQGGAAGQAARLLAAAGEKSPFNSYSWDEVAEQNKFLEDVGQDLAVLAP